MSKITAYTGADIFDGESLKPGHALLVRDGRFDDILPASQVPAETTQIDLGGGILAPGFVDLQVNGGGGVMLNADPSVTTLATMARAHLRLGTTAFLPTLITDTPQKTRATIDAVARAIAQDVPGIVGLHLEGPHLSIRRKGAHDAALIRPMQEEDLALLLDAATRLPALMVTVAPENCSAEQVSRLARAGITVSLGHSDASFDQAIAHARAGAHVATHLFNAMSPLESRAPGLVGASLQNRSVSAGLIADGIHVHPQTMALALRAKQGPGQIFLVTDAMAVAGTDLDSFTLEGRRISRADGRLTLEDGTLAGADLSMARALQVLTTEVGVATAQALAMATSIPAELMNLPHGRLRIGKPADFIHLDTGLNLQKVWKNGALEKS